ncbi:YheC/YheD family protein [Heyndrickxia ginsengihumi]|uniref:YheC/YheD family protein n=1 Tax=Heyndrickxia ginsengihumi TaxID=363870 RepID=UPI0020410E66|nr:YheC/YheD family protein [Heyndrickxia ginsengihumi]MCM3022958.1 YheC/YheD family protein [Heyndrickxia ginsengihumi]
MSTKLGILTLDPQTQQEFFHEIGKRARKYDIELFLFSPLNIVPASHKVEGYCFHSDINEWKQSEFSLPLYLYDRCIYEEDSKSKNAKRVVSWLKSRSDTTFLGYGLPNKWVLYEELKNNPLISPYLVETTKASLPEKIISKLSADHPIILKPIDGNRSAIYSIEQIENNVLVKTTRAEKVVAKSFESMADCKQWLEIILRKHIYLMQRKLNNVNKNNQPYALRMLLQKDHAGNWHEVTRKIRVGDKNGLLTNTSENIYTYEGLKKQFPHFNVTYIENEIDEIITQLPKQLEQTFHPLFELEVDIILANDQSIWIIDINSKPKMISADKIETNRLEQLIEAPLAYCQFLSTSKNGLI